MRHHRHGGRKQTQRSTHHQKLYSHSADLLDSRGIIPSAVDSKPLRNDAELLNYKGKHPPPPPPSPPRPASASPASPARVAFEDGPGPQQFGTVHGVKV